MSTALPQRHVEQLLAHAEARIALLSRCQPENAGAERQRLLAAHRRGDALVPEYRYAPPPDLSELARGLVHAAAALERGDVLARLYAERCRELQLEAELAGCVGQPGFAALARRRFSAGRGEDAERAATLADAWTRALPAAPTPELTYRSDDTHEPRSLLSCLARRLGELRLACRLIVDERLSALAATGDAVIHVKAGVWLGARQAERITAHEVEAHALPRERARSEACGLLRVGSAHAVEDEEGRALLIEERGGWLDAERRRTLGLRHECASALAGGADWTECLRQLARRGCSAEAGLGLMERVGRGGGLCRELVYLPAWCRLSRELAREPELERWLERGRVSLAAARVLRERDGGAAAV
ncbi:MAG: tyrosine/phenylalanine carboxypeptidase domain-containing protein [Polyangiaceae bacterium]